MCFLLDIIKQLLRFLNWFIWFTYILNTHCCSSLSSEPRGLFMTYLQMLFLDHFWSTCLDFTIMLAFYTNLILSLMDCRHPCLLAYYPASYQFHSKPLFQLHNYSIYINSFSNYSVLIYPFLTWNKYLRIFF